MSGEERLSLAVVSDPDPDTLGSAMSACTALERRYVIALCESGGQDHTRALAMAGDGCTTQASRRVMAFTMYRRPRVQEALKEESLKRLNSFGLMAASNLIDMARSSRDEKVKLKANLELMNRTGLGAIQKIDVRHTDASKTDDEIIKRMTELVRKNPDYLDMVPDPIKGAVMALLPKPMKDVTAEVVFEIENVEPDPDADIFG